MKKIFITGASSYVAKPSIKFLKKENKLILNLRKKNKFLDKKIKITNIDFTKKFKINFNIDYLLHFASLTPKTKNKNLSYYNVNVEGFKNLLSNIKKCKKIFLLSSISVYAKTNKEIIDENSNLEKKNTYGKSKHIMEEMLIKYCKKKKIDYLILRSPGIYDKKLMANNFITRLAKAIKDKKKIKINNLTKKFNNVTDPDTIFKFVKKFLYSSKLNNQIYNLSSKSKNLIDIINFLEIKYNTKAKLQYISNKKYFFISQKKIINSNIILPTIKSIINK